MKKTLLRSIYSLLLLSSCLAHAQNTTVFITSTEEPEKRKGSGFFDDFGKFSQFTVSFPFRANPEYGQSYNNANNSNWFLPDGLSAHAGFGGHVYESIGFTANTGVDWQITPKAVIVPVYGSLIVNPSIDEESSILLQAGLGRSFAIGHGDVSGTFQKYRVGYISNYFGIFAEANYYGFPWKGIAQISTINLGICLLNFD